MLLTSSEMSVANKNLTTAIAETYEAEWTKDDTVRSHLQVTFIV